jgi:hypothetical protein
MRNDEGRMSGQESTQRDVRVARERKADGGRGRRAGGGKSSRWGGLGTHRDGDIAIHLRLCATAARFQRFMLLLAKQLAQRFFCAGTDLVRVWSLRKSDLNSSKIETP